jgi:hypothetical protein
MRLYGFCTRCRRIKPVRVTQHGSKLVMGVCAQCERDRRAVKR